MYTIYYKGDDVQRFDTVTEAVIFFDEKGWGFHNWTIYKNNIEITHDEFFNDLDEEKRYFNTGKLTN